MNFFQKIKETRAERKRCLPVKLFIRLRTVASQKFYVQKFPDGFWTMREDWQAEFVYRTRLNRYETKDLAMNACDSLRVEYILNEVAKRREFLPKKIY